MTRTILILALASCLVIIPSTASGTAADLEAGVRELAQQISVSMNNASVHKIAIVDFVDLNGNVTTLGQFLAEELTTQLFLVSPAQFQVVERRQLMRVLEEQRLTMTGLIDSSTLVSVGKILGIEALVTGSITDLGNEIKVNARLIATDTARVFSVASTAIPNVGTVKELISQRAFTRPSPCSSNSPVASSGSITAGGRLRAESVSVAISAYRKQAALALRLENSSDRPLHLAAAGGDAGVLTSDRGEVSHRSRATGLPTLHPWNTNSLSRRSEYITLDPGSTLVILFELEFRNPIEGSRFSFACDLFEWVGDEEHGRLSIGLSDLVPEEDGRSRD